MSETPMADAADRLHEMADELGEDGLEDIARALHEFAREFAAALKAKKEAERDVKALRELLRDALNKSVVNGDDLFSPALMNRMTDVSAAIDSAMGKGKA